MKTNRTVFSAFILALALLVSACSTLQLEVENTENETSELVEPTTSPTEILEVQPTATEGTSVESTTPPTEILEVQSTATEEGTSVDSAIKRYSFEELGISMELPSDLYVRKDPIVSLNDSSKLESYLFYIQNYGHPGGSTSGDFQMYGHLQFGPFMTVSWDEFSDNTLNSPMNAYANYIEIDGLRGYDTQLSGQRNRFVYLFHLDQYVLSIAVAAPTPENKALADQIISTLKVIPGGLSDTSHVQVVTEPNSLYQLLLPEDWEYTFNPNPNINLSEFEARSPDFEILVEEGAGHSDIYYKRGVVMTLIVFEGDSIMEEVPYKDGIESMDSVYFNGIEGKDYIFVEPSTAEGKLRQVHTHHNGKNYILRFGHSSDADTDAIDQIIANLEITPENFAFPY